MIHQQIKNDMREALKARESVRLTTLRGVLSSFTNELVATNRKPDEELPDDDAITVIKRAVKQRRDSIEQFETGGRQELADKEKEELAILERYLPAQASDEEIARAVRDAIDETGTTDPAKAGIVVGAVMKKLGGNADGSAVKRIVEEHLAS